MKIEVAKEFSNGYTSALFQQRIAPNRLDMLPHAASEWVSARLRRSKLEVLLLRHRTPTGGFPDSLLLRLCVALQRR
jgi:hypothetical protein